MRPSSSSDFSMVILISQPAWKKKQLSILIGRNNMFLWVDFVEESLQKWLVEQKNAAWVSQQLKMPTLSVTGFVHQARVLCQLCVDFCHLTRKWREKLTGSLYTFQGTKILWNTNTQAAHIALKAQCYQNTAPIWSILTHLFKSLADFRKSTVHNVT